MCPVGAAPRVFCWSRHPPLSPPGHCVSSRWFRLCLYLRLPKPVCTLLHVPEIKRDTRSGGRLAKAAALGRGMGPRFSQAKPSQAKPSQAKRRCLVLWAWVCDRARGHACGRLRRWAYCRRPALACGRRARRHEAHAPDCQPWLLSYSLCKPECWCSPEHRQGPLLRVCFIAPRYPVSTHIGLSA